MTLGVDPVAIATAVAELARDERYAEIEALFAPQLRAVVSAETLRTALATELIRTGPVVDIAAPTSELTEAGWVRLTVAVRCEHGELAIVMSVDDAGMLNGLRLAPAVTAPWTPPPYATPRRFAEHDVTLGSGRLAVPGTVTLPRGRGRVPGVVLLSGGGPFDRDETSGSNKPLKDLAWGLASHGIAVVRFDKVTHVHSELASANDFTASDEYLSHAIAAVHLLARQPPVDPTRIFVLGHSMGGKIAPRIAAAEPSVVGLVILAGDAQSMPRTAVRVVRYLADRNPGPIAESAVESIARQAARAESPDLSPSTPAGELPFGLPASYWLDLRGYDPVSVAAALDRPMLILQGGRDYQVTVEDDLALWRAGLAHRPDVTIRVYDADNHLFFPGTGPSGPEEYEAPQHVDRAVVADIAEWLNPSRRRAARLIAGFRRRVPRR